MQLGSPFYHHMAYSQVEDGNDDVQIWRMATNMSNMKLQTANKQTSSLGIGCGASSLTCTHSLL